MGDDLPFRVIGVMEKRGSGGFFGGPVSMVNNAIGTGRVYGYDPESGLFNPKSDWLTV